MQVRYDDVILPASYHYPSPELPTDLCSNPHLCHIVLLFVLLKKMAKKCSKKFSDTSCNRNLMVSDPDPDLFDSASRGFYKRGYRIQQLTATVKWSNWSN